jgi:hypothetical protein
MTAALGKAKFDRVHEFMVRHIGRADLSARLGCRFLGFSEPHSEMPSIPTKQAFLAGQHYFLNDDQSIAFGSSFP